MLSWNTPRQTWEKLPEPDLAQNIYDELGIAYRRYDNMCDQGMDYHDPVRARLDAYLTGLEKLLDWSE